MGLREELPDRRAEGIDSMLVPRRVELAVGGAAGTTTGCIRYSFRLTDVFVGSSKGDEASLGEEVAPDREFGMRRRHRWVGTSSLVTNLRQREQVR